MKVDLDQKTQKALATMVNSSAIAKWENNKHLCNFEVGDVLIKLCRRGDSWEPENITSGTKMPQRYVYIHKDAYGVGYVKQLKVSDGTLGEIISSVLELDFDWYRYEVDPEYAEHVILDAEFDIKSLHKKANESKRLAQKMNRKMGLKANSLKEYNAFFQKLNPGDLFHLSSDYTGSYTKSFKLVTKKTIDVKTLDRENSWEWRRFKNNGSNRVDADVAIVFTYDHMPVTKKGSINTSFSFEYDSYILYTQEPAKESKQ